MLIGYGGEDLLLISFRVEGEWVTRRYHVVNLLAEVRGVLELVHLNDIVAREVGQMNRVTSRRY